MIDRRLAGASVLVLLAAAPAAAQTPDISDRLQLCQSCHGENGLPQQPDTPIIWGQNFYYLYVQLKDYQAKRRANDIMNGIAADLSKDEMQALAKHFSEQAWPRIEFQATDAEVAAAHQAAVAGGCTGCHLGNYHGNNSDVPRIAGQQPAYLERTTHEMKDRIRANNPFMTTLLSTYSDADLKALAHWLAGM
ncbi:MAG TPA: cytochrome c4 [Methylomirabilota bacterium]|nr:cytochrome c4 [Methylomirabilota bacterium]